MLTGVGRVQQCAKQALTVVIARGGYQAPACGLRVACLNAEGAWITGLVEWVTVTEPDSFAGVWNLDYLRGTGNNPSKSRLIKQGASDPS